MSKGNENVKIVFGFEGRELEQGLNKFESWMKRVNDRNRKMNETGRKLTKDLLSGFKGAAVAATGYGYSLAKVIQQSSNLEEATNKFNVVFRGVSRNMEGWLKGLRNNFAMSETSARSFLASTQDLLKPMGVQANTAAVLSRGMESSRLVLPDKTVKTCAI